MRARILRSLDSRPNPAHLSGDFAVAGIQREERILRPAAVLVPLVEREQELTVLLTQRTDHLHHHGGQISFPGGRVEETDAGPVETALREAEEEIGLSRSHVQIAGFMDLYQTVTGFLVTPVVGFVQPPMQLSLDTFEVAEAFEVPLSFVLDPSNHERRSMLYRGEQRHFYVIPYQNRYIWGATAAMLVNLAAKVSAA